MRSWANWLLMIVKAATERGRPFFSLGLIMVNLCKMYRLSLTRRQSSLDGFIQLGHDHTSFRRFRQLRNAHLHRWPRMGALLFR